MKNSPIYMADTSLYKDLEELRQLKEEIKVLEEREKAVKQSIADKIGNAECICNNEGTVIATYKFQVQQRFNTQLFKQTHQELYDNYLEDKEVRTLLLKD